MSKIEINNIRCTINNISFKFFDKSSREYVLRILAAEHRKLCNERGEGHYSMIYKATLDDVIN